MKNSKVLATTTLAGALLFTGVGATHHANAAENVTKSQAEESVKNYVTNNNSFNPASDTKYTEWHMDDTTNTYPVSNSYQIIFAEKSNQSPTPLYVKKDTGDIYDWNGNLLQKGSLGSENNTQVNQTTTSNTTSDNTTTQNTQSNNETANNDTQSTTQALPETGEESNSGLVTIVASVLLATGSLLAFRRTSNSK